MPNHIVNIISLKGDKAKINEMLEAIKTEEFGLGSVDFDKVIPMPESLRVESGSRSDNCYAEYKDFIDVYTMYGTQNMDKLLNIPEKAEKAFLQARTTLSRDDFEFGKQLYQNELKYGASTWYDWCIKNWGTKWNSYGYDFHDRSDMENNPSLGFNTAWSAPHPIIAKLAEMYPEVSFEHIWADEDIGQNCGRSTYENGQHKEVFYPQGENAVTFALDTWNKLKSDEPEIVEPVEEQNM